MAGIAVVATGVGLFAQDLSPRGSEQDGAHPVSGPPATQSRGVSSPAARSAESETSRAPGPANRENSGEGLVGDGKGIAWFTAGDADDRAARLREAAEQGKVTAQFLLGFIYRDGRGVPQDGVPQDDRQAVQWYRKAAEQGHESAQSNLGVMYHEGRGIPKDDRQAVQWYRKAAEQGDAIAQFNLGLKYANGEGVPKDDVQAYAWANLAGAQGHESARELRADLSANMTRAQIAEAQKLSRELAAHLCKLSFFPRDC